MQPRTRQKREQRIPAARGIGTRLHRQRHAVKDDGGRDLVAHEHVNHLEAEIQILGRRLVEAQLARARVGGPVEPGAREITKCLQIRLFKYNGPIDHIISMVIVREGNAPRARVDRTPRRFELGVADVHGARDWAQREQQALNTHSDGMKATGSPVERGERIVPRKKYRQPAVVCGVRASGCGRASRAKRKRGVG